MATVTIQTEGIDEALEELDEYEERLLDMRPAWQSAAEELRLTVMERFDTETDFLGVPFAPLKEKTIRYRKPGKILTQTAVLRTSVHATGDAEGVTFGTNVPYAGRQHYGDEKNHPPRGFLPVDAADDFIDEPGTPGGALFDEIESILLDFIEDAHHGSR